MSNVENYFEQAGSNKDNKLVINGSFETGGSQSLKKVIVCGHIADVSTVGSVSSIPSPVSGVVSKVWIATDGAIATADATLSIEVVRSGIASNIASLVVETGGFGYGQVFSAIPSSNSRVEIGDALAARSDGASTNAVSGTVAFEIVLD